MPRFGGTPDIAEDEMLGTSGEIGGDDASSVVPGGSEMGMAPDWGILSELLFAAEGEGKPSMV